MRVQRIRRSSGGFTIVEVVVAVALMTTIAIGTMSVLMSSTQLDNDSAQTFKAEHELQGAVDYVRSITYATLSSSLVPNMSSGTVTTLNAALKTTSFTPAYNTVDSGTISAGTQGLSGETVAFQYYYVDTTTSPWDDTHTFSNHYGGVFPTNSMPAECEIRITVSWTETWKNGNVNTNASSGGGSVTNNGATSTRTRSISATLQRSTAF